MPRGKNGTRGRIFNPGLKTGNTPKGGNLLGTHAAGGWDLWVYRVQASAKGETWANLKLVSVAPRVRKANYWLAYCLTRKDYGATRDYGQLELDFPELLPWIERLVLDNLHETPPGDIETIEDLI